MGDDILRKEKHALKINSEAAIPTLARRIQHGRVGANPGIVHQEVDLSVGLERRLYDLLDLILVGHVTLDKDRLAASAADLVGGVASRFIVPIDEHNLGALARKHFGYTLANPCGSAGYDCDSVF
jgi:hypothetical protein